MDEFSQQPNNFLETGRTSPSSAARWDEDNSLSLLMQELSGIVEVEEKEKLSAGATSPCLKIPQEAARLLWETANALSDSRPPADFCVYNKAGERAPPGDNEQIPPIFDGSVANATPPPLGGASAGASVGEF